MAFEVKGLIHGLGRAKLYADGSEPMEILVPKNRAEGLPYSYGVDVAIDLQIGGGHYKAVLKSTDRNGNVYVSQSVRDKDGVSEKLSHVLTHAGFKKNDKVVLEVDGHSFILEAESSANGSTSGAGFFFHHDHNLSPQPGCNRGGAGTREWQLRDMREASAFQTRKRWFSVS